MKMQALPVSRSSVAQVSSLINKALGYPRPGVQVGQGHRAPIAAQWDGNGTAPLGWTTRATEEFEAEDGSVALKLPGKLARELAKPEARARLTAGERTQLDAVVAARKEIPEKALTAQAIEAEGAKK